MDESSLFKQKIEFLEIQLQEFQQREHSIKTHFESVINSILAVSSPNISQEFALKIEELKKNHSNELLILKFFYKQRVDNLQEKVIKLEKGESKELSNLKSEKEFAENTLKELSFENQQLRVQKQLLEGKLESLQKKDEEIERFKERLCKKKETWRLKKSAIREENKKNRENMEKSVDQLRALYQNQASLSTDPNNSSKVIEEIVEKLKVCLIDTARRNLNSENLHEFKYFMHEIDTKLFKILGTLESNDKCESLTDFSILTVKNKNISNIPKAEGKVFTFTSPTTVKNNENIEFLANTSRKFSLSHSPKPPIHSFSHKRAQTVSALNPGPFIFQCSDRLSVQNTTDYSVSKQEPSKPSLETLIAHLKIQLSKVKNQRDKIKLENDRILLELKDSKFNLAFEKEKNSEKLNKVENESKKISSIVKTLPEGLENYQREIARSVFIISKIIS